MAARETSMARWLAWWSLALALAACSTAPPAPPPQSLFHDEFFAPTPRSIDARDIFALDGAMQAYLHNGAKSLLYVRDRAE